MSTLDTAMQLLPERPHVVTTSYPTWVPPPLSLVEQVEDQSSYSELFVSDGQLAILEASVREAGLLDGTASGAQPAYAYPRAVALELTEHTPRLREVLNAGCTITVDNGGRPHFTVSSRADTNMNTDEIRSRAITAGCEDEQMIWSLQYGARHIPIQCRAMRYTTGTTRQLGPQEGGNGADPR